MMHGLGGIILCRRHEKVGRLVRTVQPFLVLGVEHVKVGDFAVFPEVAGLGH
jgi:hypothetical protein